MEQSDTIILKLKSALDADGDFPTRARVISELQRLTEDPKTPVNKVVETVLREPSLATRILHLVNSVMYSKSGQITTLSQAVLHLGLKTIYDLCANFVLMQRFTPLAKKGSAFFDCFMLSLLTANISSIIDKKDRGESSEEEGYLSGSLFTLGPLLLGYYFPKLFEDAAKRSERRKISLFQSVGELLGIPAVGVSLGVVDSLSVPEAYKEKLTEAFKWYTNAQQKCLDPIESSTARSISFATIISEKIIEAKDSASLKAELTEVCELYNYELDSLIEDLKKIPLMIKGQAELLEIGTDSLPTPFLNLLEGKLNDFSEETSMEDSRVAPYIEQLEQALRDGETLPSMVASVMEAMLFAFDFERVLYMELDLSGSQLNAKLGLGDDLGDYDKLSVDVLNKLEQNIVNKSYQSGSIVCNGEAMLDNAWPFLAMPVGYEDRTLGIIYADRIDRGDLDTLPEEVSFSCSLFSDILDRALLKRRE